MRTVLFDLNVIWLTSGDVQLHFAFRHEKPLAPPNVRKISQTFPIHVRRRESHGELLEALNFPVPELVVPPCQPLCLPVPFNIVHPIAFHFGTLTIRWYGVLVM